jgi:hypothetical protein
VVVVAGAEVATRRKRGVEAKRFSVGIVAGERMVEAGAVEMMSGLQRFDARQIGEKMAQLVVGHVGGRCSRIAATEEELQTWANI